MPYGAISYNLRIFFDFCSDVRDAVRTSQQCLGIVSNSPFKAVSDISGYDCSSPKIIFIKHVKLGSFTYMKKNRNVLK